MSTAALKWGGEGARLAPRMRSGYVSGEFRRGRVIALEPIAAAGVRYPRTAADGWTLGSADRSLTTH
jgi:hypothetical protein